MESYILNEKNLKMVKDLVIKKVFSETGEILDDQDPFFKNNTIMIIMAVLEGEAANFKKYPVEKAILKLNTIIIVECVNFFIESKQEQQSSRIEDLQEEEVLYKQEFPEKVLQDVAEPRVIIEEQKEPVFKKEILFFEQNETNEFFLNFDMIKKVKLNMFAVDFCDYIITEKNNSFYIDSDLIKIPIGNYSPENIPDKYFKYDPLEEKFSTKAKINFDLKNSLGPVLGFKKKTYKENLSEDKHNLSHKKFISLKVYYDEIVKEYKIPTNVKYNSCIFFESDNDILLSSLKKIKIELDYNTRGRKYFFKLQVN